MERLETSDVKVGAFVLVALAILVAGLLWIAGSTILGTKRASYKVLMQNSGGLQAGDRVRFAGVSVGRVQGFVLRPGEEWPVALNVSIKRDIPIRVDSTATVRTSGLLGSSFLQVDAGSPNSPLLPEGGEIHAAVAQGIEAALARAEEMADKFSGLLDQTAQLLDTVNGEMGPILANLESLLSERNAEDVRQILSTLRTTIGETAPRVESLLGRLESISKQLEGGIDGLPALTADFSSLVGDLQTALGPDGKRLRRVLETAESGLASADEAMSVLGDNRGEIEATLRDLRDAASNLKAFSQQVKERPFSLVRIKPEPDRKPGKKR